jgi:ribosomal protein S18 acetylase RimI-like enzyme
MSRELGAIDARPLPEGMRLAGYGPGDESHWLAIHEDTGMYGSIGPELFEREFGDRHLVLPDRQWFVIDDDSPIATATAWFPQVDQPATSGRLHWVAVRPEYQRRGIASALTEQVLQRMVGLGYTTAYLTTGKDNFAAIALYRSLGFEPLIRSDGERAAWAQL